MGANNQAARRAAKANRRKIIVAQKRKAEALEASPAGQAAHAATLPIQACMLTASLLDHGMGTFILARGSKFGLMVVGIVLVDTFCHGAKDAFVRPIEGPKLQAYLDRLGEGSPMIPVDPSYARKLLRDLVQWSRSIGFPPARDFPIVERLFGDVDPDACKTDFVFGHEGKPLYVSGPSESLPVARRRVEQMRAHLGAGGFDYIVPV